jgi:hypothetical protein
MVPLGAQRLLSTLEYTLWDLGLLQIFCQESLTTPDSAGSRAQRDNRRLDMHQPGAGAMRRCPVQSSTPLGPDQVNVLLLSQNPFLLPCPSPIVGSGAFGASGRTTLANLAMRFSDVFNFFSLIPRVTSLS